jgi:hypothetical protein
MSDLTPFYGTGRYKPTFKKQTNTVQDKYYSDMPLPVPGQMRHTGQLSLYRRRWHPAPPPAYRISTVVTLQGYRVRCTKKSKR